MVAGSICNSRSVAGWLSALLMSCRAARILSPGVTVGVKVLLGNQCTVSAMRVLRVSQIHTLWHWYDSKAGPTHQPSMPCGLQLRRCDGFSWTSARMPGGAIGVRLKS